MMGLYAANVEFETALYNLGTALESKNIWNLNCYVISWWVASM
jgi:hypothetical protein